MNPNEVNRINYNCYYIGQNLDTLVRNKMKSESFITPLKVTPKYYDDEVFTKMKLLGKRGHYYPREYNNMQQGENVNEYYNQQRGYYQNQNQQQRFAPTPHRAENFSFEPQRNITGKFNQEEYEKFKREELMRREMERNEQQGQLLQNTQLQQQQQQQREMQGRDERNLNYHYQG